MRVMAMGLSLLVALPSQGPAHADQPDNSAAFGLIDPLMKPSRLSVQFSEQLLQAKARQRTEAERVIVAPADAREYDLITLAPALPVLFRSASYTESNPQRRDLSFDYIGPCVQRADLKMRYGDYIIGQPVKPAPMLPGSVSTGAPYKPRVSVYYDLGPTVGQDHQFRIIFEFIEEPAENWCLANVQAIQW